MPHLKLEYSANLEEQTDLPALVDSLHRAMAATGLFELGGIRVRAFRADHVAIADRAPQNAFLDLQLRVGAGRGQDELRRAGDQILAAAEAALAPLMATPHFALSMEIIEIGPLNWKRNSMHQRLRKV